MSTIGADKLQRNAFAEELVNPVEQRGAAVGNIHHVLLLQHNNALDLLLLNLGLIFELPTHTPE